LQGGSVQQLIDRHRRTSAEPPFSERLCRSIFRGVCEVRSRWLNRIGIAGM
jgi:hypothetical protein